MADTQITAAPGVPQIVMTREFDAPPDVLFRAYTDPALLVRWLGPRRMSMTVDRYELRDGGVWRFVHRDESGTEHCFHGVFHGMPSVDGIVRTFEYEGAPGHVSLETLTLEDRGGRTLARTNAVFQSVEARDGMIGGGMEEGLNDSYRRLDDLVADLVPVS